MYVRSNFSGNPEGKSNLPPAQQPVRSTADFLFVLALTIFLVEAAVMVFAFYFDIQDKKFWVLLNPILLVVISAPILYFHPGEDYPPRVINSMLSQSHLMKIEMCYQTIGYFVFPYICYKNKDMPPVTVSSLNDRGPKHFLDLMGAAPGTTDSVIPNPGNFDGYKVKVYGREVIYSNKKF